MKCGDVIAIADRLRPNQYGSADKIIWLSDCDCDIWFNVMLRHEDCPEGGYEGYGNAEDELLLPEEYGREIYLYYLLAQIDFHNAETAKYNQSAARYNAAYKAWLDYYNKEHLPKTYGRIRF